MMNPKEIRLQQEVFKQKLIVKRLYKEARELLVKNKELRVALSGLLDSSLIDHVEGDRVFIARKALEGESLT